VSTFIVSPSVTPTTRPWMTSWAKADVVME
jgi:hypothetical protein